MTDPYGSQGKFGARKKYTQRRIAESRPGILPVDDKERQDDGVEDINDSLSTVEQEVHCAITLASLIHG